MIQSRRRRRYGVQTLTPSTSRSRGKVIVLSILIILIGWGVWSLLKSFSPAVTGSSVATFLSTDGRGNVQVKISGESISQRAESGLRLYDGDFVSTGGGSYASLHFFDGTIVTLDSGSSVLLDEVIRGEQSLLSLRVEGGSVWVDTSTGTTVRRLIHTASAGHVVPPNTRMLFADEELYVFASSGPGVETNINLSSRTKASVIVGEGQQLSLSPTRISDIKQTGIDPYSLRSALDSRILSSDFYVYSQKSADEIPEVVTEIIEQTVDGELLVVDAPEDGTELSGEAVLVKGRVGSRVVSVSVNGYSSELSEGAFEKEVALPNEEEFSVEIQAEDKDGLIIATKALSLTRDIKPPEPPIITFPGGSGDTIQINDDEFEIIGTASSDSIGVVVNGYQLQKYRPGSPWSYLVDPELGNVRIGENTYEVVTIDRSGNKSIPVRIDILWKAQPLPSVSDDEDTARDSAEYVAPGTLSVIAPTNGSAYKTSEQEVLIEGNTSPETYSISINGFNLTKYLPEKITWNYIASSEYGNYKNGVNRYTVVARNSEGKILDVLQYVIERR